MSAKEHKRFAAEIAKHLNDGLKAGEFGALWIFASAPFLGELKAYLSDAVSCPSTAARRSNLGVSEAIKLKRKRLTAAS